MDRARGGPRDASCPRRSDRGPRPAAAVRGRRRRAREPRTGVRGDPPCPTLRANPCPEVSDPACRLPLLASSCGPEAVHLGDLMRSWVRSATDLARVPIFNVRRPLPGRARHRRAPTPTVPHLRARRFRGACDVSQKRELSPGRPPSSPNAVALPRVRYAGAGTTPRFPFAVRRVFGENPCRRFRPFGRGLGSAHPRACRVLGEPFSASALGPPTRVLATTTEICTSGRSNPGHPVVFRATGAFAYSTGVIPRPTAGFEACG